VAFPGASLLQRTSAIASSTPLKEGVSTRSAATSFGTALGSIGICDLTTGVLGFETSTTFTVVAGQGYVTK